MNEFVTHPGPNVARELALFLLADLSPSKAVLIDGATAFAVARSGGKQITVLPDPQRDRPSDCFASTNLEPF